METKKMIEPATWVAETSGLAFPVVGIGASAGGFPALERLLQNMPPSPGMALVVILHLPANEPSSADKVLQRATTLPVVQVNHTMPILPNHVYVIPPDRALRMRDGQLILDELHRIKGDPLTIDIFFRTLGEAHKERAIGVILSGMGLDGTVGLLCIREQGGVTIAQLPEDAEERSMPHSAIDSGMADFVLTAPQIPRKLIELRDTFLAIRQRAAGGHTSGTAAGVDAGPGPQESLNDVLSLLYTRTGHDFRQYKEQTLLRRMERRLQVRGMPDLPSYYHLLEKDASEPDALMKDLLIGVTSFFRDREAFDALERIVLPGMFFSRQPGDQVRAWIAACSTGEEAYTVAMLLADRASGLPHPPKLQVFASDIDERAIDVARAGLYPVSIANDVSPERLERYFTLEGDRYKVRKALRDQILFSQHNLLHDPAFSRVDLITCRNFLIYLNREKQSQVLEMFHFALNPGGYLMLGIAETADSASHLFTCVDIQHRIYQARPVARATPRDYAVSARRTPPLTTIERSETRPGTRRGRLFSFAEIHLHKVAELAPPSILVNANSEIVHVSERAGRFLHLGKGEPTRDIVALVAPGMQLELRAALFQAQKSGKQAATGPVRYKRDGNEELAEIAVMPFHDEHAEGMLMLVTFNETRNVPVQVPQAKVRDQQLMRQLDEELRHTRQNLHDTMDQAEISGARMQATNEELQTAIEELRSTARELEHSNEELQSVNEELNTVNEQLKIKAEETAKANDDLKNLIASTDIATVFLDRAMCIQRYTPGMTDVFNVIPADVGRSLHHITNKLNYPQLAEEAAKVFETLQPMEREVRSQDGRYYIVRVHPYRTTEDRIVGAVMTFFDITDRRSAEVALHASETRLRRMMNIEGVGVLIFREDGMLLDANDAALQMIGYDQAEVQSGSITWRTMTPLEYHAESEEQMRVLQETGKIGPYEKEYLHKHGSRTWMLFAGAALGDGTFIEYCINIEDRKRAESALLASEAQLAANLAGMQRLYGLHSALSNETSLHIALDEILAAACEFTGTNRGCVQLVSEDGKHLEIVVQRGYGPDSPFINYFRNEGFAQGCHVARMEQRRLLIEDTANFPGLVGTPAGEVVQADAIRAAQSTPMINHKGETIGVLSTQFRQPHRPTEQELKLIDLLAWTAADFLERHNAYAAVHESEIRLRTLLEGFAQAFWEADAEGRVVTDSPSWRAFTGQAPEELLGEGWANAVHPDDRAYAIRQWRDAVAAKHKVNAEFRLRRADGDWSWTSVRAAPLFDEDGSVRKWVGMNIDIGDRHRAQ